MGTKIHCTSYLPGLCTMMDLNKNADGYWSQYYGDKALRRNNYNVYQLRPSNGYSGYDKEMLKRTMLEHEAIFRKQVYELHRLYRIQKDMMNELKKGPSRHLEAGSSDPSSFSSQIPSEGINGLFQMATASNSRPPHTVTNDEIPVLNFLNRSETEVGINEGGMLESNHKVLSRRTVDLQLPADVYIDCEEEERLEKEIVDASSSITNNPKLTLGIVEGPNSREESSISDIRAQSGPTAQSLADLNEPTKEICFGKGAVSVSTRFLGSKPPSAENQGLLPMRSNAGLSGIPNAFLKGRNWDVGTSSNPMHAGDDETSQEWPFLNKEAGQITSGGKLFNPGSFKEKFSMPSGQIQLNQKPREILSLDQNKRETWFTPNLETCQRNFHYGQSATPFPNPSSDVSLDYTGAASPLLSSWTKATNGYGKNYSRDMSSHYRIGVDPTYYQNCHNQYSPASQPLTKGSIFGNPGDSGPQKSEKEVNLNQTLLNGYPNGFTTQKNNGLDAKWEDSSIALPWLRKTPTCESSYVMELDLSQGYPQLKMNPRYERRHETEKNVNLLNLQDLPSSSHVKETAMETAVASDGPSGKKIFGFSIPEKTQQTDAAKSNDKDRSETPLEDLGAKTFRDHINLNIDLNSSDLSAECAMLEASLQQVSAPSVAPKIDLEAPIALEEENPDVVIREAAESMLLMSSDKLPPVSYSTLHWFVEVVSSNAKNVKENSDDVLDSFEMMTLDLEETKPDEYLCRSWEEQNQKDDGDDDDGKSNVASLLFTRPRRGRARKRRKIDFQKDILPGIASLSRQEVMEDLQTIGGTMRRNSNRNGINCGGRKPRSLAHTVEHVHVSPTPPLPPPPEVEIDGRNMIGWGRTTRRCRRRRFAPITNVAAPLT